MHTGVTGLMCTGKSHIGKLYAGLVKEHLDQDVAIVDIAGYLKKAAADAFGVDIPYVESHKGDFRVWLQEYGQLLRQYKGEDFLIREAMKKGQMLPHAYIENIRMMNESALLEHYSWFLFGVITDEDIRLARFKRKYGRKPTSAELNHPTEKDVQLILETGIPIFANNTEQDAQLIAEWLFERTKILDDPTEQEG